MKARINKKPPIKKAFQKNVRTAKWAAMKSVKKNAVPPKGY